MLSAVVSHNLVLGQFLDLNMVTEKKRYITIINFIIIIIIITLLVRVSKFVQILCEEQRVLYECLQF
jgi:hypothetical protein